MCVCVLIVARCMCVSAWCVCMCIHTHTTQAISVCARILLYFSVCVHAETCELQKNRFCMLRAGGFGHKLINKHRYLYLSTH